MANPAQLNNLQAAAQPQQLSYLENIIDKKVNGIALTCLEGFVDWFLRTFSCFYPAYDRLYQEQLSRIKHFPDGTVVKDLTIGKIASVITEKRVNIFEELRRTRGENVPQGNHDLDYIGLNGRKVLFAPEEGTEVLWGRAHRTERVTVETSPLHPEQVTITELETTGEVKQATVDTTKLYTRRLPFGNQETVYVTEEAIAGIQDADMGYLVPQA